ncbi:Hypothetical protein CINCED_3A020748 [Cinara cedri]|uniref:Myb/SANT-like DNA-binding domain-containing protein n=1 Tax=Cinara cedri TaxID=506608 RepID=A0A5E4N5Z5_9HEMI|nr:Hypothetical protein CINCED_3A020748 [Cinara cedri]
MKLKRLYWRQEETRYFLTLCIKRNVMSKYGLHRKDDIFEMLSKDMRDVGFIKTPAQCKTKLKHLKEDFNRRRKITPFVDEMEKLLASHIKKKSKAALDPVVPMNLEPIKPLTMPKPIVIENPSAWTENSYSATSNDRFDISSSIENTTIKTEIVEDNITTVWNDTELDNMDVSEVDEYSRTSGIIGTLPPEPQNDNHLLPDNSNNIIIRDLPTSSNIGINSNLIQVPKKSPCCQHQQFMNYLIKNQQKFVQDMLETQKKWTMDMMDKIHQYQATQLKIMVDNLEEAKIQEIK